jgi:hypothetical protein
MRRKVTRVSKPPTEITQIRSHFMRRRHERLFPVLKDSNQRPSWFGILQQCVNALRYLRHVVGWNIGIDFKLAIKNSR